MCSKDKATTKDMVGKRTARYHAVLGGHCTVTPFPTSIMQNHAHIAAEIRNTLFVAAAGFLSARANSTSPVEGKLLTLAKLG